VIGHWKKSARGISKCQVEIEGQSFLLDLECTVAKNGFFTMHFVKAIAPSFAENAAVRMIPETQRLWDLVRNTSDQPPVTDVVQIV
jgi:hypothetical protein